MLSSKRIHRAGKQFPARGLSKCLEASARGGGIHSSLIPPWLQPRVKEAINFMHRIRQ
jgi:hypothetical protein